MKDEGGRRKEESGECGPGIMQKVIWLRKAEWGERKAGRGTGLGSAFGFPPAACKKLGFCIIGPPGGETALQNRNSQGPVRTRKHGESSRERYE